MNLRGIPRRLRGSGWLVGNLARYGLERVPYGFGKNLLAGCVWMNSVGQIH